MQGLFNVGGQVELRDAPPPEAAAGKVRVRVVKTAISQGTELYRLGIARPETVEALGYIATGVVEANDEPAAPFKPGDRVFAPAPHGTLAYVDPRFVVPIPAELDFRAAVSCYWAIPALRGIHRLAPRFYDNIAVIGQGAIGLSALQMLRRIAGRLVAIDVDADRLAKSRQIGADLCVNAAAMEPSAVVEQVAALLPEGPSRVLEASGTRAGLETALKIVRPRGTVVCLRMPGDLSGLDLNKYMYFKDLALIASGAPGRPPEIEQLFDRSPKLMGNAGGVPIEDWHFRREIEAALDMIRAGVLQPELTITHEMTPPDAPAVYAALQRKAGSEKYLGVVIDWAQATAKKE